MAAAAATVRRATVFVVAAALAVCSCGWGAQGFVLPSPALMPAQARASIPAATARACGTFSTSVSTTATPPAAAAALRAPSRSRTAFRLYSSKGPSTSGGSRAADIMDSIGGLGRELTTEEKIAALREEVQAQAARTAEMDEAVEEAEDAEMAIPGTGAEAEESSAAGFFSKEVDFVAEEGFVDEGKNIRWPNPRRAAQLTLLAVVAQIAFIVYIISLNSLLNTIPQYFQQLVDLIKSNISSA